MNNSDAYNRFLENLCEGDEAGLKVMLNNNMVNQCNQLVFRNGMSEVETLKAAILAMIKVSNADLEEKLIKAMNSAAPNAIASNFNKGE